MKQKTDRRSGLEKVHLRGPLNIRRAESGEKFFRQSKQKIARRVDPLRRFFVTNDGKDSADSLCADFLEVPLKCCQKVLWNPKQPSEARMLPRKVLAAGGSLFTQDTT